MKFNNIYLLQISIPISASVENFHLNHQPLMIIPNIYSISLIPSLLISWPSIKNSFSYFFPIYLFIIHLFILLWSSTGFVFYLMGYNLSFILIVKLCHIWPVGILSTNSYLHLLCFYHF